MLKICSRKYLNRARLVTALSKLDWYSMHYLDFPLLPKNFGEMTQAERKVFTAGLQRRCQEVLKEIEEVDCRGARPDQPLSQMLQQLVQELDALYIRLRKKPLSKEELPGRVGLILKAARIPVPARLDQRLDDVLEWARIDATKLKKTVLPSGVICLEMLE